MSCSPLSANQGESQNQASNPKKRIYRHRYCVVTFDEEWPIAYYIFRNMDCKNKENVSGVLKCDIACSDEDASGDFVLKTWKATIIHSGNHIFCVFFVVLV
jgi:hypothetical protein